MTAAAKKGSAVVTLIGDRQLRITREFDAPRHLVFKAWTTPELVKQWWTSRRGSMKVTDIDLRVGGKWRWVMVADGGFEVAFHGEYKEIVPNERLVFTEAFEGMPDADAAAALNTMVLTEAKGRTTMSMLVEHVRPEHRDAHINSGMEAGMQDAMDLLEEVARSLAT